MKLLLVIVVLLGVVNALGRTKPSPRSPYGHLITKELFDCLAECRYTMEFGCDEDCYWLHPIDLGPRAIRTAPQQADQRNYGLFRKCVKEDDLWVCTN